ncbi:MAG: heme-binding protein [Acidobacteria bacterium]|nr:heme-binding protein [Acidobacteriota bacterium]MBI3423356.1 heme-binding protein [Acidobacteriota bacterium]
MNFPLPCGLEGVRVPICTAAISKAVTACFLSSNGHAFTPRTASFIVQEHFPPGISFQGSGPLFGVQFSQLLCSDVNPKAPLGLSAGAGALPLYKNGIKVGAIGIEGDGRYAFDPLPADLDIALEEVAALAGARGFEPPSSITGDKIIVNGIRFPYVDAAAPPALPLKPFNQLPGAITACCLRQDVPDSCIAPTSVIASKATEFITATVGDAPAGRINTRLFPSGTASFGSTPDLARDEVIRILTQAAKQASITRAAIRQPLNSAAEVNITVCDPNGKLLGIFSTADAPQFGFDVSAQKARTAAFFSNGAAATLLRQVGLGKYVDAAARDGLRLDGSVAFSDRAIGFLARPLYPDGIDRTLPGPFSLPLTDFSPFNVGFQLDAIREGYFENILKFVRDKDILALKDAITTPCGNPLLSAAVNNGFQIFPGSVPLYKNGKLVGAIGVSGDGVDQDDLIATMGSTGFEAPANIRTDQIFVRGTRLPYVKFPRQPNRDL